MMTNRARKRSETPAQQERRLNAELEAAKAEGRPPEFDEDDVTCVTRLLEARHSRITDLGARRISAGFRSPVRGPIEHVKRGS